MILNADRISWGKIVKLENNFFYLADNSSPDKELIKVRKFKDWACASRFAAYEVGQEVVLLMKKEKDHFSIMSAGGEGEIPIINDSVKIKLRCFSYPKNWIDDEYRMSEDSLSKYHFISKERYGGQVKISLPELMNTIKEIKQKYSWQNIANLTCNELMHNCTDKVYPIINDGTFTGFIIAGMFNEKLRTCKYLYNENGDKM